MRTYDVDIPYYSKPANERYAVRQGTVACGAGGRPFPQETAHAAHEELEVRSGAGMTRRVFGGRHAELALDDPHHPLGALEDPGVVDGRPAPLGIVDDAKGNGSRPGGVERHARLLLDDAQGLLAHKALGRGEALEPVAQKVGPMGAIARLLNDKVDVVGEGDDEVLPQLLARGSRDHVYDLPRNLDASEGNLGEERLQPAVCPITPGRVDEADQPLIQETPDLVGVYQTPACNDGLFARLVDGDGNVVVQDYLKPKERGARLT